jgi:hypothetical protein
MGASRTTACGAFHQMKQLGTRGYLRRRRWRPHFSLAKTPLGLQIWCDQSALVAWRVLAQSVPSSALFFVYAMQQFFLVAAYCVMTVRITHDVIHGPGNVPGAYVADNGAIVGR